MGTSVQPKSKYFPWTVPDGFSNNLEVYLTAGSASSTLHDEKSFQQEAKSSLKVSGGGKAFGVDMEFTAGASWSSATSSLSEGTTVQQRFTREAGAYTTSVVAASSKLSDAYLKTLTTAFVVDNWSLFFSSYGTHVTTEVTVGARYSQVTTFERTKFEELQSNEAAYNAGIKASYDGATGSVDASHSHSSTDRSMVENSSTRQFIVSNGGDGATLDANTTETTKMYQVAAHNYPSPLRATLIPHEILITVSKWSEFKDALVKYYPDDEKAKSVTTQDFESAWVTAIDKYCGDDAHKCSSVSSFAAPEKMTLTTMHFDSPVWGQHQDGNVVSWPNMPDFQAYKAMIKISAIRTFCSRVSHGRSRFRGLQFEYFDGDRSAATSILGTKGDSDSGAGEKWDSELNKIAYGEIISGVEIASGADIDGIWFIVQSQKDQSTRRVGCGYSSPQMTTWNVENGRRLLAFSGTGTQMDGFTIVKQIQFRSYLYILPTPTASGKPDCHCVTPNMGTAEFNGAACTNGDFEWCSSNQYCTNGSPFPKSEMDAQCNENPISNFLATPPTTFLKAAAPPSSHHKVLLQQIEKLKASKKVKESNEAAAKDSKHSKWNEAKHEMKEMSKHQDDQTAILSFTVLLELLCLCLCLYCYGGSSELKMKEEVKEELKDLILKEMKTAIGDIHNKQSQLEDTVTRMLVHQIESF